MYKSLKLYLAISSLKVVSSCLLILRFLGGWGGNGGGVGTLYRAFETGRGGGGGIVVVEVVVVEFVVSSENILHAQLFLEEFQFNESSNVL